MPMDEVQLFTRKVVRSPLFRYINPLVLIVLIWGGFTHNTLVMWICLGWFFAVGLYLLLATTYIRYKNSKK